MKHEIKTYAVIAAVAVIAVGIVHAIIRPMLPASLQAYIV